MFAVLGVYIDSPLYHFKFGVTVFIKENAPVQVITQIIEVQNSQNMTQLELALRVGTQKSNISRLESGTYNPSLEFLSKVTRSLGKEVQITLK